MSIDPCNKPPLTLGQQAEKLKKMGLSSGDVEDIVSRLMFVNYDRLAGYWYQFWIDEQAKCPVFTDDVTIDTVWQCYRFDRRLRLMVLDAVERIEIAIRTQSVYHHVLKYGAKGYVDKRTFEYPKRLFTGRKRSINSFTVDDLCKGKNPDSIVERYKKECPNEKYLPFWKLVQLLDFGWVKDIFLSLDNDLSEIILKQFNLARRHKKIMKSWLESLRVVRNICAHHSRLFNKRKLFDIMIPDERYQLEWYSPVRIATEKNKGKLFPILTMMGFMLKIIIPGSKWLVRLKLLLNEFSMIPREAMGFPKDWERSPLWITDDEKAEGVEHATI